MRKICFVIIAVACFGNLTAQNTNGSLVYAFKITDYIKPMDDSSIIVQVVTPTDWPVDFSLKQVCIMRHLYQSGKVLDTATIGTGSCQLIKGMYNYFTIRLSKGQTAKAGDLLYTRFNIPVVYNGLLLKLKQHAIELTDVYGTKFFESAAVFSNTSQSETVILDSMIADIKLTGKAMQEQIPDQNQTVSGGLFNGKKIFTVMQEVAWTDLQKFLKYIDARPRNYAGNTWKLSEIFATWVVSKTPTTIE